MGSMAASDAEMAEGESRTELDSHADTWVCGRNSKIISVTDDYVDLTSFTK